MGTSRRGSARWASTRAAVEADVDVLIPTARNGAELAVTLAGLAAQDDPRFSVIIGDQSGNGVTRSPSVRAMVRVLRAQGRRVELHRHLPRAGLAEHRQFLLDLATAPRVLFLDDDVWLEPGAFERLSDALTRLDCGFVGYAPQGLSHLPRPCPRDFGVFEPWPESTVLSERIRPGDAAVGRWILHNAANVAHLAERLELLDDSALPYRVAWVGGCVLFDRAALLDAGGFAFWPLLDPDHIGEDRVAQWLVMERFGGAGILPSGAVHIESPSVLPAGAREASEVVFGSSPSVLQ
ncbi:MAG TPA: glycosyltransferase family 2 protein [Candidatus Agrococcus pullicola]|uniref:Glycosyltransferase family 2 protein n=1 Tax=Candidatus Agrococcus pullicola TaxID=2838429 RepID=A0A9D1YUU9_9MICO|nr:glycosyltransferase family 2 protein [Candidatus Agrococcus pullicola]